MIAEHFGLMSVLKCSEKRSDSDLNLSWGGNKKKVDKMWRGKGRACFSSRLQCKHGEVSK
jgi:hypothetical protein